MKTYVHTHIKPVLNVYSIFFPNHKKSEKTKCPSRGDWINKSWYINTVDYDAGIKEWIIDMHNLDLECIILREENLTRKTTCYRTPFIWHCRKGKIIQGENKPVVTRQGFSGGVDNKETWGIFWGDRTVLYLVCHCSYWNIFICQKSYNYTLKRINFLSKYTLITAFPYNWFLCNPRYFITMH